MLAEHYEAFRAVLASPAILSNKVFDALRVNGTEPVRANYVVATPSLPALRNERYAQQQSTHSSARWRFDVKVVATTPAGVMVLVDAALGLIGRVPVVDGRWCTALAVTEPLEEGDVRHDREVNLYYLNLEFEFWSRPAR